MSDRTVAGHQVAEPSGCQGEGSSSYSASLEKHGLRLGRVSAPVEKLIVDRRDTVPTEN